MKMNHKKYVKKYLKNHKKRYIHCLETARLCKKLAKIYKLDSKKSFLMGLYHDMFKYLNIDEHKSWMDIFDFEEFKNSEELLHGFSLSNYLYHFILDDIDVYNAIYNHTYGRIDMNDYEKILLIADKAEKSRPYKSKAEKIRHIAYKDLNKAVIIVLKHSLDFLNQKNVKPRQEQIEILKYYERLENGK